MYFVSAGQLRCDCVSLLATTLLGYKLVAAWPLYLDSYCVCKALSLSKPRFRNWTELPLFLSLLEREAFESWKALLCYLLSFKLDVACVSLGDVRVFSSATALCGFACCFYKCKLISGGSVASLAEATMDSLLAFVNSASLELVAAVSFCLSSRF